MKKTICLLMLTLILATGCGSKKMICKKEENSEITSVTTMVEIKLKDDIVDDINMKLTYQNADVAKGMCEALMSGSDSIKCDGNNISIGNYQKSISEEALNKEEIKSYFESQEYICEE